jgi:hypothetical protein
VISTLFFDIRTCNLDLAVDSLTETDHSAFHISLSLNFPAGVKNQQGTEIPNSQWTLYLVDQASTEKIEKPKGCIGVVKYRPPTQHRKMPSAIIHAETKATHFTRILALAQARHLSGKMKITAQGAETEGDQVIWNMRDHAELEVLSTSFSLVLAGHEGSDA